METIWALCTAVGILIIIFVGIFLNVKCTEVRRLEDNMYAEKAGSICDKKDCYFYMEAYRREDGHFFFKGFYSRTLAPCSLCKYNKKISFFREG